MKNLEKVLNGKNQNKKIKTLGDLLEARKIELAKTSKARLEAFLKANKKGYVKKA